MSRQRVLLIVLGALALIALWRYFGPGDDEAPAPPAAAPAAARAADPEDGGTRGAPAPAPGSRRGSRDAPVREVLDLHLAALQHDPESYTPGRDPWRFFEPPPVPPPVHRPTAAEIARDRAAAELAARLRAEAEERARLDALVPKPPPFTLKYLGNFGPAERRLAVFTDGKTIYNVKEGGTIDGKFTVNHIGFESVDIGFVGFADTPPQRLPAGG